MNRGYIYKYIYIYRAHGKIFYPFICGGFWLQTHVLPIQIPLLKLKNKNRHYLSPFLSFNPNTSIRIKPNIGLAFHNIPNTPFTFGYFINDSHQRWIITNKPTHNVCRSPAYRVEKSICFVCLVLSFVALCNEYTGFTYQRE